VLSSITFPLQEEILIKEGQLFTTAYLMCKIYAQTLAAVMSSDLT
jgi:hypothetical protein